MELTYKNNLGKIEVVGNYSSRKDIFNAIEKKLHLDPYNSPYMRLVGTSNDTLMIDFGSHSNFFYVDISYDDFVNLNN